MNTSHPHVTTGTRLAIGLGMIAFGLMPLLATFDIGPLGPEDINGASWLGLAAGGTIIAGGLAFLVGPNRPILNGLLGLVAMCGLAAIGNWIAFGYGERVCSGSILVWTRDLAGMGCRIPFGIGALITNAICILCAVILLQLACGGPPRLTRVRRAAEGLLFLSFAPILLPIFLILLAKAAFEAVKVRFTTGNLPRNEAFIARQRARRNQDP